MEAGPGATAQIGDTRLPIGTSLQSINLFAGALGFGVLLCRQGGYKGDVTLGRGWDRMGIFGMGRELGSQFDRVCTFITAGLGFLY